MLESEIEKKVNAYAKKLGFLTYKFQSASCRGVPDQIYIKNGAVIFIEFKSANGKLTPLQNREIKRIRQKGVEVHVINNVDLGVSILDNIVNNKGNKYQSYYEAGANASENEQMTTGMSLGQKCAWRAGFLESKGISWDEYNMVNNYSH